MKKPPLGSIDFGRASAEKEGIENPLLLLDGFLDLWDIRQKLISGTPFLVLGYKGSGNSAIGEHLRLRAESNPTEFVRRLDLADIPFSSFPEQGPGEPDTTRITATWRFALMIEMFESFLSDSGSSSEADTDVRNAITALRQAGLLPSKGLPVAIRTSRSRKVNLSLPGVGSIEEGATSDVPNIPDTAGAVLVDIACRFRSGSTHTLILDGLDAMFISTSWQLTVLAALVNTVDGINARMMQAGSQAKIVVLCRTDIFERLPSPNKNKLRQDSAIELAWYQNETRASDSKLFRVATMKARVTDEDTQNIIEERFPAIVVSASGRNSKSVYSFLIERIRHVPRDLLMLLAAIQRVDPGRFMASSDEVRAGAYNYSVKYFLPEMKDEMSGFFGESSIADIFTLLGRMRRQTFSIGDRDWVRSANGLATPQDILVRCLSHLYEVGGVGMMQVVPGGRPFYSFRFRNPHSSFDASRRICIHKGLHAALNIPSF